MTACLACVLVYIYFFLWLVALQLLMSQNNKEEQEKRGLKHFPDPIFLPTFLLIFPSPQGCLALTLQKAAS